MSDIASAIRVSEISRDVHVIENRRSLTRRADAQPLAGSAIRGGVHPCSWFLLPQADVCSDICHHGLRIAQRHTCSFSLVQKPAGP